MTETAIDSEELSADSGSQEPAVNVCRPEIRPASEPTCCGSGCADCPF